MNVLSITVNGSTLLIVLLILVFMAIIGYYADKTKYSKDYKKKKTEGKKAKKIDLSNTRINDLVGEKKEGAESDNQSENVEQADINASADVQIAESDVPQELYSSLEETTTNQELIFDEKDNNEPKEELVFDGQSDKEETLVFDNENNESADNNIVDNEENQESETLSFDSDTIEQNETLTFDAEVKNDSEISVDNLEAERKPESSDINSTENSLPENENVSENLNIVENNDVSLDESVTGETLDLETIVGQANEEKNQYNEEVSNNIQMSDDNFEMDKDLEKKLKADILESIKSVEEETTDISNTMELESFVRSNNTSVSSNSLDDDLGISELPKLKVNKETDSDKLSVDDIFKL